MATLTNSGRSVWPSTPHQLNLVLSSLTAGRAATASILWATDMKFSDHIALRGRSIDFSALGFYLPNPDPILKTRGGRIELYRELRTDAHVGGCIRRRKSAVKALEWGVDRDRAKSRVTREIEAMFADMDLERLIGEAMDAVLYGYQPMEILWERRGSLVVPGEVIGKPPEWFHFDAENRLRFKTRENPMHGEEIPAMKFLLPRQDATYQNPYGFADLSMCFWPIVFKKGGVKFWLAFTEKFGSAFSLGKLPRGATAEERASMLDSLESLIQDGVATIPDDGSVELVEMAGKSASADLYEKLVMYCRSEVSIALTGTNQTTEASSNKASASAGLEVADDLRDGDAEIVAAAINQLIRWVVEINWGNAAAPVFELWDQEARDKIQAERDKSLKDAGANLTRAYFIRSYNLQEGDIAEPPPALVNPAATSENTPKTQADQVASNMAQQADAAKAEFSEVQAVEIPQADDSDRLSTATQPTVDDLLGTISEMVNSAGDLTELQRNLLNAYGDLDSAELTSLMAAAFALAELKGIAAVRLESGFSTSTSPMEKS
jgi:phage gp29-like protein